VKVALRSPNRLASDAPTRATVVARKTGPINSQKPTDQIRDQQLPARHAERTAFRPRSSRHSGFAPADLCSKTGFCQCRRGHGVQPGTRRSWETVHENPRHLWRLCLDASGEQNTSEDRDGQSHANGRCPPAKQLSTSLIASCRHALGLRRAANTCDQRPGASNVSARSGASLSM
jgi:hypothetical protein